MRGRIARPAVLVVGALSRQLGLGGGSTVGGRAGLLIDPSLLGRLAVGRVVTLVSGTNGKTTTTRLLAETLGGPSAVATSTAGANMPAGLVAALAASPPGAPGVLEVDEGYLGQVADAVAARVVVLLNLSRDQLDRVGEVRMVAARWRAALARTAATVVANCDDPLVTWAAEPARDVVWVAAGGGWSDDARHCPACQGRIAFERDSLVAGASAGATSPGSPGTQEAMRRGWSCRCGLRRPEPAATVEAGSLVIDGRTVPLALSLPGRFNQANAAMAAVAATVLGVEPERALAAMSGVVEVAGRYAATPAGEVRARLLLAKNPAGWSELVELLAGGSGPVVLGINAREADGRDPSWLWDVPFERLAHRVAVATGDRRRDLAMRLRHAGLAHAVVTDQLDALTSAGVAEVDYVGNYTAFQDLRHALGRRSSMGGGDRRRMHPPGPDLGGVLSRSPAPPAPVRAASRRRRAPRLDLSVVVVHPDLLVTYGDSGNGLVLANRAAWRGIGAELVLAASDEPLPTSGDLYCLGGGEDGPQTRSATVLAGGTLAAAVARGAVVLAVCAGFQIVGSVFPGPGGAPQAGVGLVDAETVRGGGRRAVGEVRAIPGPAAAALGVGETLTGFENHAGVTRLGQGVAPLGRVVAGVGNGAVSSSGDSEAAGEDGCVAGHIVATYLHGPVLARNPALADALLVLATGVALEPLDDEEEAALRTDLLGAAHAPGRLGRRRALGVG